MVIPNMVMVFPTLRQIQTFCEHFDLSSARVCHVVKSVTKDSTPVTFQIIYIDITRCQSCLDG